MKLEKKQRRRNRKRLAEKDPVTEEIYEYVIQRAEQNYRETYQGARLRLALALLAVTGVRVGELLPLKINQLENLFKQSWISIDRAKSGPSNHKTFLTPKGMKIIKNVLETLKFFYMLRKNILACLHHNTQVNL